MTAYLHCLYNTFIIIDYLLFSVMHINLVLAGMTQTDHMTVVHYHYIIKHGDCLYQHTIISPDMILMKSIPTMLLFSNY